MCIRYALTASREDFVREFGVTTCPEDFPTGYNIGPGQLLPVICRTPGGELAVRLRWWGLVPPGTRARGLHANFRAETLPKKPSLHEACRERRCIVPASGFFAWADEGLEHQPNYIQPVAGTLVGLAGFWEPGELPAGESRETFAILTVQANPRLMPIHHRMPVVLPRDGYGAWLDPGTPRQEVARLVHACDPEPLLSYPVSMAVNRRENNTPEVISPLPNAVV